MTTLTIRAKGQITLRKDLLQHLGVGPGDKIEVSVLPDGRLEIKATQPAGGIEAIFGLLADKTQQTATIKTMNEGVAKAWAGQEWGLP